MLATRHPQRGRRIAALARNGRLLAAAGLAALGVAACNGSDSSYAPPQVAPTTQLRAIHASSDAPNVDVVVNGSTAFTNVAYPGATAFATIPAGTTSIGVEPTGTSNTVLSASATLAAGHQYSAVVVGLAAAGTPAAEQLRAVLVEDPGNAPASGNAKLRVVHGAPGVPTVDLYVTAPGASLPAAPTIPGLAYAAVAPVSGQPALEVPGGNYEVRATVTGDANKAVVVDSGSISVPAAADLLIVAFPASGVAPVQLLVAPASGSAAVIADTRAAVRVGHLSPNVPAVDVQLDVSGTTNSVLSLSNVTFPQNSGYALVAGGAYDASVALASNPATPVLTLPNATLKANTSTSVFAIGLLGGAGAQALHLAAYADDRTPVAGKAKVRVIHLAPDAPAVDVVALDASHNIAATLVKNLAYPNATPSDLQVAPGAYTLAVVPTGQVTPVLPTASGVPVTLTAGEVVTVAAVGCLNVTVGPCAGGSPFEFTVLQDN